MIRLFNYIDKNPNNVQLVCIVDNIALMNEDLRRNQIYFTSKNQYRESILVSLFDFKNVKKMIYLVESI